MEELTGRVIDLEIRYSHQNNLVEELNVELTAANARIDQLEKRIRVLFEMLGRLEPDLTQSPDEQ